MTPYSALMNAPLFAPLTNKAGPAPPSGGIQIHGTRGLTYIVRVLYVRLGDAQGEDERDAIFEWNGGRLRMFSSNAVGIRCETDWEDVERVQAIVNANGLWMRNVVSGSLKVEVQLQDNVDGPEHQPRVYICDQTGQPDVTSLAPSTVLSSSSVYQEPSGSGSGMSQGSTQR